MRFFTATQGLCPGASAFDGSDETLAEHGHGQYGGPQSQQHTDQRKAYGAGGRSFDTGHRRSHGNGPTRQRRVRKRVVRVNAFDGVVPNQAVVRRSSRRHQLRFGLLSQQRVNAVTAPDKAAVAVNYGHYPIGWQLLVQGSFFPVIHRESLRHHKRFAACSHRRHVKAGEQFFGDWFKQQIGDQRLLGGDHLRSTIA